MNKTLKEKENNIVAILILLDFVVQYENTIKTKYNKLVAILILLDFVVQLYLYSHYNYCIISRNPYFTRFCCAMRKCTGISVQ